MKMITSHTDRKGRAMRIDGERMYLKILSENDVYVFTQLLIRNKEYWSMYEPRFSDSYYTVDTQRDKIKRSMQAYREKRELNFGIYLYETNQLIGHISLYNVKRLPFLSGFVGYSIDEAQAGNGYATEALSLVADYAFQRLSLHRLEAYVSPENEGSIRTLEKNEFVREGLLRNLIYINGVWEDHYLYALLRKDYEAQLN